MDQNANPNESELSFQYESIRINLNSDWTKLNFQSEIIRMNPNGWNYLDRIELEIWLGLIRAQMDPDWFVLKSYFLLIWISILDWIGINRIGLDWFLTGFHQTRYTLAKVSDLHWFWTNRDANPNELELTSQYESIRINLNTDWTELNF